MLNFNHQTFWQQRLVLLEIDAECLGRRMRNSRTGGRSRNALVKMDWNGEAVNMDRWAGTAVLNGFDLMQEFVDAYPAMRRICTRIASEEWMP